MKDIIGRPIKKIYNKTVFHFKNDIACHFKILYCHSKHLRKEKREIIINKTNSKR